MPLRVSNSVERNVSCAGSVPITIPAGKAVDVLVDVSGVIQEYAGRYVQNVGSGIAYYAFGSDASPAGFNGVLFQASAVDSNGFGSGQQLDCSNHGAKVSVYSVAGTTIAVTILRRNDLAQGNGGAISNGSII